MIIAFNKPYGVVPEFTQKGPGSRTLAEFRFPKGAYPVERLDRESEGLMILSDEKGLGEKLLGGDKPHERTFHVQVERTASEDAVLMLQRGVVIQGKKTKLCEAKLLADPHYPPRNPPIRFRLSVPTSWIELTMIEGDHRLVRRMTASAGFLTLRLIRAGMGKFRIGGLAFGKWQDLYEAQRKLLLRRDSRSEEERARAFREAENARQRPRA